MDVFPASGALRALAAASALTVVLAAPVAAAPAGWAPDGRIVVAQGGAPPVRLGPRRGAGPEPPAAQPARPESPPQSPPTPETGPVPLVLPDVEVQTLSEIDPESTGVLDDAQGGLGIDMWRGADRETVSRLLALLPRRAASPVLRDLMRRLLLTRATAPQVAARDKGAASRLLARRVEALFAIGDLEGALRLLRTAAPERAAETLVENQVEALFFINDNAGACHEVRARAQGFTGAYWMQATAYCLALAGDNAKASLVSELLAERRAEVVPAFFVMMDSITGGRAGTVRSLADPKALHLSMVRAANLALPADVVKSGRPAVLRTVALSPNADFALRLEAAEGAFAAGALAVEQLLEIYANVPFEPGELASPLSAAEAAWGPRGRALLMRAASLQDVPTARAEVLQRALQLGRERGGLPFVTAASVPLLAEIAPAGELMWFAREAARVMFAANRADIALGWYGLARQEATSNQSAAETAIALWPLAALAGNEDAAGNAAAAYDRWMASLPKDMPAAEKAARAQRLLALLEAGGIAIGDAAWARTVADAPLAATPGPGPALAQMLARAAAERRRGEAVTLALIALGDAGPAASTLAVAPALRALRAVGLEAEARAIALEAAVAGGL